MRLRSLIPRLSGALWAIEAGSMLTYFGVGLVLPFQVLYLHNVRDFSLETAGAIVGTYAPFALLGTALGGPLVDRLGPRRCVAATLLAGSVGGAALAFATVPWQAFALSAFAGIGGGIFVPARSALLASLADANQRHAAYGLQFAAANLGIALGAGVGGLIASPSTLGAYQALFLANAAVGACFGALILIVTRGRGVASAGEVEDAEAVPGRYRDLLEHRALIGFMAVTALVGLGGLAVFEVGLPVFARNDEGLDERSIGLLFVVNSLAIVVAQFPVTKLLEGRRRLRAVALALGLWASAWLLVAVAAPAASGVADIALLVAVVALVALGECLIAPIQGALVVDLTPEPLRGRGFAAQSGAYAVGMSVGPPLVGIVLSRDASLLWVGGAGVLALAAVLAFALDASVPEEARWTPVAERLGSSSAQL